MYEEFNRVAGAVADREMYMKEIEPMYLAFEALSKEAVAVMYWGGKPGAHGLWSRGTTLRREKEVLGRAAAELAAAGLRSSADRIRADLKAREAEFIRDVKAMMGGTAA